MVFQIRMVMTHHGVRGSGSGSGSKSGSGYATEPIDERLCKLIRTEVTMGVLDTTPVIFGTTKEGMMEIMEELLKSFRSNIATGQVGARTPSF